MTQQIAWGIVADADVETVKFRMLGEARYYLGETLQL